MSDITEHRELPAIARKIRARKLAVYALENGDLQSAVNFMMESKSAEIEMIQAQYSRLSEVQETLRRC